MYYEINVSKNGQHYFATAERSLRDQEQAHQAAQDFKIRFPKSEGFDVQMQRWDSIGTRIDISGGGRW